MFVKDYEGYTAFDVYNSTVDGTKPLPDRHPRDPIDSSIARVPADLYTWGTNRNASLGLGDASNRTHPDHVVLRPLEASTPGQPRHNLDDLRPVPVLGVEMSKLHTTVITAEAKSNVRSCGFASGGRLGPATATTSHSQYALLPSQVGALPHQVVGVALGQDHTLALTSSGEVFSWGLNRFGQLGYAVEGKAAGDEPLQASARRVLGTLRNAVVVGVAASKSASACWTTTNLYTWGTNGGQFCACFHGFLSSLKTHWGNNRLRQAWSNSSPTSSGFPGCATSRGSRYDGYNNTCTPQNRRGALPI